MNLLQPNTGEKVDVLAHEMMQNIETLWDQYKQDQVQLNGVQINFLIDTQRVLARYLEATGNADNGQAKDGQ